MMRVNTIVGLHHQHLNHQGKEYMKIDTYLLMGEKEFFDTMKKYNRYLTSKERHILVIVAERFIKLKEKEQG